MPADSTNKIREKKLSRFDNNFIQNTKRDIKNEKNKLNLFWFWSIPLYIILIFFFIFFTWYTVFTTTHSYYLVQGASMKNTYNSEIDDTDKKSVVDAVYVNKNDKVEIFDVVVIDNSSDSIIKRVVGQAGDYVSIVAGEYDGVNCFYLYRISAKKFESMSTEEKANYVDTALVEDSGSYRIKSYKDWLSNTYTKIEHDGITYEKKFYDRFLEDQSKYDYFKSNAGIIYVKVPTGKVFCLGDNRAHSQDSRYDGFYDLKQVVGRVEIVIYNQNFGNRFWGVIKYYFAEIEKFFAR